MKRLSRLGQSAVAGIDPGDSDHAWIGRRIRWWRRRAVIADGRHDQDTVRTRRCDRSLKQRIGRPYQAHIDYATDDRRLVFHSFRHTFKRRGTTARINSRILDQLCGHAPTTVGDKYGEGQPLCVLHEDLHLIDFNCVEWAPIRDATAHVDWEQIIRLLPPAQSGAR
jgi:hypothetical protein